MGLGDRRGVKDPMGGGDSMRVGDPMNAGDRRGVMDPMGVGVPMGVGFPRGCVLGTLSGTLPSGAAVGSELPSCFPPPKFSISHKGGGAAAGIVWAALHYPELPEKSLVFHAPLSSCLYIFSVLHF